MSQTNQGAAAERRAEYDAFCEWVRETPGKPFSDMAWEAWKDGRARLRAALKAQPAPITPMDQESLDEKALNALLWFYRRAKNAYGRLPFAEEAITGLRARIAQPAPTEAQGDAGITASGPTHEQSMAGYAVACKFGVFEGRAFTLAHEMFAAFGQPVAHVETQDQRIERQNMQGMADCMDMVHGEFIEAGIIDKSTPPMMITNAVCAHIAAIRNSSNISSSSHFPEIEGVAATGEYRQMFMQWWQNHMDDSEFFNRTVRLLGITAEQLASIPGLAVQGEDSARLQCAHTNGRTAHWDWVTCDDCGAIYTGPGEREWGIAQNMWFKSESEAKFYKANGRYPDRAAPQPQEQTCRK